MKRMENLQAGRENCMIMKKNGGKVSKRYSKEKISEPVNVKSRMKTCQNYPVGHSKDF